MFPLPSIDLYINNFGFSRFFQKLVYQGSVTDLVLNFVSDLLHPRRNERTSSLSDWHGLNMMIIRVAMA